jgi:hypothetical protein
MPSKTTKDGAARRRLVKKIEQIIYDYVFDSFGRTEAEDPSWYTPDLAKYVADALSAPRYVGKYPVKYEQQ